MRFIIFREVGAILRNFTINDCRIMQNDSRHRVRVWYQRSRTVVRFSIEALVGYRDMTL